MLREEGKTVCKKIIQEMHSGEQTPSEVPKLFSLQKQGEKVFSVQRAL